MRTSLVLEEELILRRLFLSARLGDPAAVNHYGMDFGRMDDLPAADVIGADLMDSSDLDQYLRHQNPSVGTWTDTEQYYYHYHAAAASAVAAASSSSSSSLTSSAITASAAATAADTYASTVNSTAAAAVRYHEMQPNVAVKQQFSVCQSSYQCVINNFN